MKCPKCGLARGIEDRICRRCKLLFGEDRFIALTPPRAADRTLLDRVGALRVRERLRERLRLRVSDVRILVPASLIPGLGHAISGRPARGLSFLVLVGLLFFLSVRLFSGTSGQALFGLAVSIHAFCILDVTSWGAWPQAVRRGAAMGAVLGVLLFLYWPAVGVLANALVSSRRLDRDDLSRFQDWAIHRDRAVVMILLFIATFAVASWLGRRLSSRDL